MRKRIMPLLLLAALFLIPVIAAVVQYNDRKLTINHHQDDSKLQRAETRVITDPEELKKYAEENGLPYVPIKVELEYNGPAITSEKR